MGELEVLVDRFAARREDVQRRVERAVLAEFTKFDGWYSPRLVEEITAAVATKIAAAQMGTAQLTDAYLSRTTSYVVGTYVAGASVPQVMGQTLRMGVADHEEVYGRVAAEYRRQRSLGVEEQRALSIALARAQAMLSTDMGLAVQHQTKRFTEVRNVARYRRVLRPELSKGGACGLCVAASDKLYRRGDLMPVHARCKCAVIAVTVASDPGSQLNSDTLGELYTQAGSTAGADLKRVRVTVEQHGELGPQLRVAGQKFRGPDDVADAA